MISEIDNQKMRVFLSDVMSDVERDGKGGRVSLPFGRQSRLARLYPSLELDFSLDGIVQLVGVYPVMKRVSRRCLQWKGCGKGI